MGNLSSDWQSILYVFIIQLLFHIPTIAVYIVGIIISFIKSEKHPKISYLSGAGFGILLILTFASTIFSVLPAYLYSQKYNSQSIGYILSIINTITLVIGAAASALLIRAIWKDRA